MDDVSDKKIDRLVELVNHDFQFNKNMFIGGLTRLDAVRLKKEKEEQKLKQKATENVDDGLNEDHNRDGVWHHMEVDYDHIVALVFSKFNSTFVDITSKLNTNGLMLADLYSQFRSLEIKIISVVDSKIKTIEDAVMAKMRNSLDDNFTNGEETSSHNTWRGNVDGNNDGYIVPPPGYCTLPTQDDATTTLLVCTNYNIGICPEQAKRAQEAAIDTITHVIASINGSNNQPDRNGDTVMERDACFPQCNQDVLSSPDLSRHTDGPRVDNITVEVIVLNQHMLGCRD